MVYLVFPAKLYNTQNNNIYIFRRTIFNDQKSKFLIEGVKIYIVCFVSISSFLQDKHSCLKVINRDKNEDLSRLQICFVYTKGSSIID